MITLEVEQSLVPNSSQFSDADVLRFSHVFSSEFPKFSGTMALSFVSDTRIQELNRIYRQKDSVTDVLSFAYSHEPGDHLGDIVISFEQAERQAEGGDIRLELIDLSVHGMLHVLGYDHERPEDAKIMFPLQDSLVAQLV